MQRLVWWVQWHRRLGAGVAVLVFLLAVTGILINHSQGLVWHRTPVYSSLLAWLYGIPVQPVEKGYVLDEHWLTQVGDQLYLDRQTLQPCHEPLQGAVKFSDMLAVLCGSHLLLLDEQGELIEQLGNLPRSASALAEREGILLLQTADAILAFNETRASWSPTAAPAQWARSEPLPIELQKFLAQHTPVPGLSRERVLLDLHSGRLFGNAGVLVVDLVGVAICLLAFSGLFTWFGRKWRHRKRR